MEDSRITLRQGLAQFYQEHQEYLSHNKDNNSKEAESFFRSHNVAHVLFGCDISLYGEGSVKIWTIFGTTLGFWNHLKGYREANTFTLSRNFSVIHFFSHIFKFLIAIPVIIIRSSRMSKRWPWSEFDAYLDRPISDIRREFNIKVLR